MNTSNSDLSIDSGASSSLDAVEDSLDRQHRDSRQQRLQHGHWPVPELSRGAHQTRIRPGPGQMSSPLTGPDGGRPGFLADPFESGSPPELPHFAQPGRHPTQALSGARGPAFHTPDMVSSSTLQQHQLGQPSMLYRFHPHQQDRQHSAFAAGYSASPLPPGPPVFHSNASSSSSMARHGSSTPQASVHTTLAGAVTPAPSRHQQPQSHERQLNPMPPPPPAPTRPTRQAPDVAQHSQHVAPNLWHAGPVRSRTSDAFASPPSSSFSADLGMHMPSFHLPGTAQPSAHSNVNLDAAALAAERRNTRGVVVNTFETPTGQAQPMLSQLERQQHEQYQQMLHQVAQQRHEQQMRVSAEQGMGAPARRMISFAPQDQVSYANTYALSQHGAPPVPSASHPSQDISLSLSSYGSLPARSGPSAGARGAVQDQSIASYATSNFEDTTSGSNVDAAIPPAPPNTAQFQKWNGSAMTVPIWVVSSTAPEEEVEEWFESDAVERFDVAAIAARSQSSAKSGDEADKEDVMNEDVLKGILETQLGLRTGLGWYGYTYRNPKSTVREDKKTKQATPKAEEGEIEPAEGDDRIQGSRKRRRISSSLSPVTGVDTADKDTPASVDDEDDNSDSETGSEAVDLIYDAFGRVRGAVPRMGYSTRGGPRVPLPPPLETAALRTAAAREATLRSYVRRSKHEARLLADLRSVREQYEALHNRKPPADGHENEPPKSTDVTTTVKSQAFYTQLKAKQQNLAHFRAKSRPALLKGLQNAILSSSSAAQPYATSLWHE